MKAAQPLAVFSAMPCSLYDVLGGDLDHWEGSLDIGLLNFSCSPVSWGTLTN